MANVTLGPITRAVSQSDVSHAADALLRGGERPTIDKVRAKIGKGSPNTINPMLDAWWKTLSARLDSGPAALHRLPETVAHVAEALWMQALEEAKRRAALEQRDSARLADLDKQRLELRSHVLTLREGELDSRLRDRDRTIEELNLRLRELTGLMRKEQITRELQAERITTLETQLLARRQPLTKPTKSRTPLAPKRRQTARRAGPLRISAKRKAPKRSAASRNKNKRR
jgi:Plasmid replication region DNA-binding N-term